MFVDATLVSPISGNGVARSGATTIDGAILRDARRENSSTYHEVHETGLGHLCCLGAEVFGRWSDDPIDIMPKLVRAKCRGLPQSVRVSLQAALSRRWWGLVGVAVQREVARAILRRAGSDLIDHALEPPPALCDLAVG